MERSVNRISPRKKVDNGLDVNNDIGNGECRQRDRPGRDALEEKARTEVVGGDGHGTY